MKKNRIRIKYVGAVAAALLAAAPVVATAVAPFVAPAVAQAADTGDGTAAEVTQQALSDAKAYIAPVDHSKQSQEYQDAYTETYQNFAKGYQLAVNDFLEGKAQGTSDVSTVASHDSGNPPFTATPQDISDAQAGYDAGYPYVQSLTAAVKTQTEKLASGGFTRETTDALRAAIKVTNLDIQIAANQPAQDLGFFISKLNADAVNFHQAATNLTPGTSDAAADAASGAKAGATDGAALQPPATNDGESDAYKDAYDKAYDEASGEAKGESDATSNPDATPDFTNKSETYQTAYEKAHAAAVQGIKDGISDAQLLKDDGTDAALAKGKAYQSGYSFGWMNYHSGYQGGVRDRAAITENNTGNDTANKQGYHDGYTLAHKTAGDLETLYKKTGFVALPADITEIVHAATGAAEQFFDNFFNIDFTELPKKLTAVEAQITKALQVVDSGSTMTPVEPSKPSNPGTPTTNPAPEFTYANGFVKDASVDQGTTFNPLTGISAWTDSNHNTAIPISNWQVSGSVDTSKPGTYTLTYTITNNYGRTATLTRTITVKAAGTLTESSASGVVYVTTAAGADLFSDNATSNALGRNLANGTAWKVFGIVKDANGDVVAYNLGGKQYVRAADVSTTPAETQKGIFTVHYPANAKWSIAVYNSNLQVLKLIKVGSSWQTFGTKTLGDGKSYFNLGGNQWVRTEYGSWIAK